MQIMHGNLVANYLQAKDHIGHIQFAAAHDRGEPDSGEINFNWLLPALMARGYEGSFGAEYKPRSTTIDGIGWLNKFRD